MRHFRDGAALAEALAAAVADALRAAIASRGASHLVVSGGTTPRRFFDLVSYSNWRTIRG